MKTRRATIWQPPVLPRWRDLFGDAAARQGFLAYWKGDGIFDTLDHLLFPLFRRLPPRLSSGFGGMIGRRFARDKFPVFRERVRANLARIRPELDAAARDTLLTDFFENRGRVVAEFSALQTIAAQGRIHARGAEIVAREHARGKGVILLGLHLANWEVVHAPLKTLGLPLRMFYQPPRRTAQHHFAVKVRAAMGTTVLPPGAAGALPAMRFLQAGGLVMMFGDEEFHGRMMAPFFGRKPHLNGNLAIIARFARSTGASVVLFHGARRGRDYDMTFEGPLDLPSARDSAAPLLDDVVALNAAIEPLIRADPGNWYFLGAPMK